MEKRKRTCWRSCKTIPCGITAECEELVKWQDAKDDNESDVAAIAPLSELAEEARKGEWWSGEWLRIFTDGGVADPDDSRIATGWYGILFRPEAPPQRGSTCRGAELGQLQSRITSSQAHPQRMQEVEDKVVDSAG